MSDTARAAAAARQARTWLADRALPLWGTRGFDARAGRFHERLAFDGSPIVTPGYRLMVQARQIATYAQASLLGWYDGAELVERCSTTMVDAYYRVDGAEGWIFSVDHAGRPRDLTRDLYGHAFVLYALAWVHRLTGSAKLLALARETLDWVESGMAGVGSGFRDAVPERDAVRRQNPHMHLFEAVLALWEATRDERFATSAAALAKMSSGIFVGRFGVVLESFDAQWRPLNRSGANLVEPGHQFEWAWLLRWYERLSGLPTDQPAAALLDHALRHGVLGQTGIVIDAVDETGRRVTLSRRSWPHAEAVKAMAIEHERGRPAMAQRAATFIDEIATTFAIERLNGGWIDHVDEHGVALVDYMPASTLYHLIGAVTEADRVFCNDRRTIDAEPAL